MVHIQVLVSDPKNLSPVAQAALQHVEAAAGRFPGQVDVMVVGLMDLAAVERGIGREPAVLVEELVIAVGQAPPAGHLVRAIEAALQRKQADNV